MRNGYVFAHTGTGTAPARIQFERRFRPQVPDNAIKR
jgi:hypothetical protein